MWGALSRITFIVSSDSSGRALLHWKQISPLVTILFLHHLFQEIRPPTFFVYQVPPPFFPVLFGTCVLFSPHALYFGHYKLTDQWTLSNRTHYGTYVPYCFLTFYLFHGTYWQLPQFKLQFSADERTKHTHTHVHQSDSDFLLIKTAHTAVGLPSLAHTVTLPANHCSIFIPTLAVYGRSNQPLWYHCLSPKGFFHLWPEERLEVRTYKHTEHSTSCFCCLRVVDFNTKLKTLIELPLKFQHTGIHHNKNNI
jgi:hypothetical protein